MRFNILIFLSLLLPITTYSLNGGDSSLAKIGFISPVEIPISLAGNFGELRPGHFHAGLDIRTQGKEGLKIRSIYTGYVSRVAISLRGYGKVVYVTHPNGYTSVYAHLREFNPKLEKFVKDWQYKNHSFELDLNVDSGRFIFNQGQLIGLSGNTGGSGGPHLHFEIRNTESETPINPLHFGFTIQDNLPPSLKTLSVYPLNENSAVDGSNKLKTFKLYSKGTNCSLSENRVIRVKGKIGFGIETSDKVVGSPFTNGVYSIELLKNNKRVYFHIMDSIRFDETRFINVHQDYYLTKKYKKKVQRSYLIEGNKLSIYQGLVNKGQLFFTDSSLYNIEYRITDFHNNQTTFKFKVKADQENHTSVEPKTANLKMIYGEENYFENEELKVKIPANALYENTDLFISKKEAIGRCVTPRYHINSLTDPLHDYITGSINIKNIPEKLRNKLLVVSLDEKSRILAAEGGEIDSNW
ncbi:MAG: M23 family metallopeptidase, partial [Salibacteraceae bacterium]